MGAKPHSKEECRSGRFRQMMFGILSRMHPESSDIASCCRAAQRCRGLQAVHVIVMLLACFWCVSAVALEGPDRRDLQLLGQSLSFLREPPNGPLQVGIVYPAGSALGRAEAQAIAAQFSGGIHAGAVTLEPHLVTVDQVTRGTGLSVLVLTDAALPDAGHIAQALAGNGVLTVAFNPATNRSHDVVMAIRGEPRVEILVNRAAAQAAGIQFSTAFRMMIQER